MYLWHIIVDCKNHLNLKTGCEKKFADLSARQVDIVDSKYIQVGQDEYKYKYKQYNTNTYRWGTNNSVNNEWQMIPRSNFPAQRSLKEATLPRCAGDILTIHIWTRESVCDNPTFEKLQAAEME